MPCRPLMGTLLNFQESGTMVLASTRLRRLIRRWIRFARQQIERRLRVMYTGMAEAAPTPSSSFRIASLRAMLQQQTPGPAQPDGGLTGLVDWADLGADSRNSPTWASCAGGDPSSWMTGP